MCDGCHVVWCIVSELSCVLCRACVMCRSVMLQCVCGVSCTIPNDV